MNQIEFLQLVGAVRNNCGLDCYGPNYYIFLHKGLKGATVNQTGYINMDNIAYIIVVCAYTWGNMGYVNNSLTQLLMVDNKFNPVESIPFGAWSFKGLKFTTFHGQFYNAWKPWPMLELSSDPSIRNYDIAWDDDKCIEWTCDDNVGVNSTFAFQFLLNAINKFVESNKEYRDQ